MRLRFTNIIWIYAFLLIVLAYISGLFIDLTGDSGLYAAISRQMSESGDWLNLRINGEPYDQKPHLFFWLAGIGIELFGNNNFAFKFFPFLAGLSSLWFIYRLAEFIFDKKAGLIASLIAGTCQIFFLYFLDIHIDTVMQAGVALALWQLAVHLKSRRYVNLVFGFLGVGLAMLSKGPLGAVLPFLFVLTYLICERDFLQIVHPKWLSGILLIVIIIFPALLYLYKNFGLQGIRFYFIDNNIGRITGKLEGSSTDPFYYIYNFIWAFLPWTLFVFASVYLEIRRLLRKDNHDSMRSALLISLLVLFFVFSIAKGKAPNYLMVMIGPMAVISSWWYNHFTTISGRSLYSVRLLQYFVVCILTILYILVVFVFRDDALFYPLIVGMISLIMVYLAVRKINRSIDKIVLVTIIATGTLNLFLNTIALPKLYSYQGCRQVLKIFEKEKLPDSKLYNFDLEEYELFFYAKDKVIEIKDWDQLDTVMSAKGSWLYTNKTKCGEIMNMNFTVDTVYEIRQRGMNRITIQFLNPATRESSLKVNYLIKTKD